eukprot:gb/GECH01012746.1/.p1 GENE.gb/GECH01012746.1/~~gb/GECH01012746.1/.p1  ORF type:complete len:758 (+),score=192.27 gb/GECH01012746.1/:1-2274(+)
MSKAPQDILGNAKSEIVLETKTVSVIIDSHSIAWVVLDYSARSVNAIDEQLCNDLKKAIQVLEQYIARSKVRVIVFYSRKSSFVVGADIHQLYPVKDRSLAKMAAKEGQDTFQLISNLKVPTVAAINGTALGGGLEICLACTYRVASRARNVQIGLPETKLGVLPGAGGTVRLPKVIGLQQALQIILPGGAVDPSKAKRLGLVDKLVDSSDRFPDENRFFHEVRRFAARLTDSRTTSANRKYKSRSIMDSIMDHTLPGQKFVGQMALKNLHKQTKGKYPAQYKALESVMYGVRNPTRKALENEANLFAELAVTPESKNLMSIYFLTEQAKKVDAKTTGQPRSVSKIGVVGAGVMGSGIAQLFAYKGYEVYMRDIKSEFVEKGLETVRDLFNQLVKRRKLSKPEAEKYISRVKGGTGVEGFQDCGMLVEAAVERMDLKKKILVECEKVIGDDAIFATNTSSLSVNELASVASRPQNVVGMHFFNPVAKMPLVEIIRGDPTSEDVAATIYDISLKLKKTPVIVNDGPGFLVNRVLGIYMSEAGRMLQEGGDIVQIDKAILNFGMPMGPFRLMDEVGLDVALHVGPILRKGLGERFAENKEFESLVREGYLGKKSGKGFYAYKKGKSAGVEPSLEQLLPHYRTGNHKLASQDIVDRCVLLMVNEAAYILDEHIAACPEDVDLGMIMGTGFAPFRGGLLNYADDRGIGNVVNRLHQLESSFGSRFRPCPLLARMAQNKELFFPDRVRIPYRERTTLPSPRL